MADPRTLVEGSLKYRDGRKWKSRWCVVSKLSPVADCLHLQLYRDSKDRCKNGPTKASLSLEGFLGMETGFTLDKESNTLALICTEVVVVLAFDSRELLIQWQVKIRTNLVEEQQFLVQIAHAPAKGKLASGPARLHLQDYKFCLTAGVPPRLLGTWPIKELRRFGVVDGKYCFEGGSRCGKGEGIHILLTNQAEELAQSVDLASRGKLHGRRKYSRKHSVDPATRMSFLPKSHGRDSDKCSTESSKPLLSSGSDGSTCDAFSDSFRIDGMGEDICNSKSNCHIHYHWPSCSYYRWAGTPATELPDLPTISDFQDQQQLSSVNSSMRNINGCPCDSQSTWSFSHCSKCGGRYCMKEGMRNGPELRQTNGNVFAPHWTMDLTIVSPSSEVAVHGRKGVFRTSVKSPPDRSSLCSQSSQSSGTSSGSSSEYSVPRSCIDTLYDRPRSMHHINGHNISRSPPRIIRGSSLDEDHKRLLGSAIKTPNQENFPACTCRFNADIPKVHGMSYPCTCWTRTMPNLQKEASSGSGSSTGSPSSSPKHASRICGTLPSKREVQAMLPCTCRRNLTSNGHYSVPRSAIANIYLKEKQLPLENGDATLERNKMTDMTPKEEYDVPKKLQEHCLQMNGHHQDNEMCKTVLCTCNKNGTDNFQMHTAISQVCTCQRVMWWAGNLVPCWRKDAGDEHLSLLDHGFVRSDSESSMSKQTQAVCREPPKLEFISETCAMHNGEETHPKEEKNPSNPNYVNLDFTNSIQEQSNYANLQFIETLPYYENVNCVLAKLSEDSCVHSELVKNQKTLKMSPSQLRKGKNYEFTGSVYELMSFPVAEEEEKLQRDDNYMVMQPVYSTKSQQSLSCVEDSDISEEEKRASEVERSDSTSLSLRPFMPYLLPCQSKNYEQELTPRMKEQDLRSTRSNSLSELKKKMLMRKRSNSADTRNENGLNDGSETDECPGSPSSCPRYSSRKTSLFSKFTLRSKEKSFSANEITPPSSVPSTPNNDSLESLHRALYHRSADCLKHEENLFSDEELSRDFDDIKYKVDCDFGCLGTSIKRSSSVPCKPSAEVSSIASPSDSGFSTSLPRSSAVSISPINNSHIVSIHNSLPRKHSLAKPEIATSLRKSKPDAEKKSERKCQKQKNDGKCRAGEYRRLIHPAASPDNHLLLEPKTVNTSSSSSDMSDYIETLSLCSRSSTSSGSSSDYVRSEEICSVTHKSTNVLKPRAGREYDSAERLGVNSDKSNQDTETNVSAVQYAVIDVVATAAAKKVGAYRSQQREEKNDGDDS
ncbi:uncharacterized protein [Centruroides vittatus]|uniref:uncharacterized protein isoform X1 n=1 Tax=Centruroides vittatus TaxID=120091 RepID=UPI00350F7C71